MIGSGNAEPIATVFEAGTKTGYCVRTDGGFFTTTTTGVILFVFNLPLATNRGDKKLHIDNIDYRISAADANNYQDYVSIRGRTKTGGATEEWINNTNRINAQNIAEAVTLTSGDMGAYHSVDVWVYSQNATASNFRVQHPHLNCYYA